jgi:hypothetical protein
MCMLRIVWVLMVTSLFLSLGLRITRIVIF